MKGLGLKVETLPAEVRNYNYGNDDGNHLLSLYCLSDTVLYPSHPLIHLILMMTYEVELTCGDTASKTK